MIKLKFRETWLFNSEVSKTPEDMFIALIVFIKSILIFFFLSMMEFIKK